MSDHERQSRNEPVQENMRLQIWGWRVERVGWYLLLLLVTLTLAGLFSRGPLSDATIHSADGQMRVDYQRFARNGAQSQLIIHLGEASPQTTVVLGGELLDGFLIDSILPQPTQSLLQERSRLSLTFARHGAPAQVNLQLKANAAGYFRSWIEHDGQRVELKQFIYP